jgi:hypothetical protein
MSLEARPASSGDAGDPVRSRSMMRLVRPGVYETAFVFPHKNPYRVTGCGRTPHWATDPGADLVIRPVAWVERGATRPWRGSSGEPRSSSTLPMVGGLATAILVAFVIRDRARRRARTGTG